MPPFGLMHHCKKSGYETLRLAPDRLKALTLLPAPARLLSALGSGTTFGDSINQKTLWNRPMRGARRKTSYQTGMQNIGGVSEPRAGGL